MKKILFLTLIITLTLTACPPDPDPDDKLKTLSGNVTVSPNGTVNVNTELTAAYSGTETVAYQWYKDNVAISGATSARYTPAAGSYTVTVNASGYTSKTSAAVTVIEPIHSHTHSYADTYTYDAAEHWRECTANDGAKTDVAAHSAGNWIIDTPATATTAGSQHKECTVCGYVTETETIPIVTTHTHQWGNWVVTTAPTTTAEGVETRTCATCGATETRAVAKLVLVDKTYPITFKNGALVFTVQYRALQSAPAPAYLTYLQTRLGEVVNSEATEAVDATGYLMGKGNSFKITIEYAGTSYEGMTWDTSLQSFKIHNDWISTASGINLSATMIMDAFESVQ